MDFVGAKVALFCGNAILTLLRDDKPGIPWPGMWDLPDGGREGHEVPETCLPRELSEGFGLWLASDRLTWRRVFPSIMDARRSSVFFGSWLSPPEIAAIRFGDEGQGWQMMPVAAFVEHSRAVPEMQRRAALVWTDLRPRPSGSFGVITV